MARDVENLVDRLVEEVALCGTHGFDPSTLQGVLESIIHRNPTHERSDAVNAADESVDNELFNTVRKRLEKHREIETIITSESNGPVGGENVASTARETQTLPKSKRLYATQERMWQTLTGHGVDYLEIPPLEFDCLSVIAAHGSEGAIQANVRKLTGQHKHSVPKRTDNLADKGYILKTAVLQKGQETSLLRLKRLVTAEGISHDDPNRRAISRGQKGTLIVDLAPLLTQTVELMKLQPDHIMAVQDLGVALGFNQKEDKETRQLLKCVRRLADSGCFMKCSARPCDETGAVIMQEIRCLRLVREPTAADKAKWLGSYFNIEGRREKVTTQGDDAPRGALRRAHRPLPVRAEVDVLDDEEEGSEADSDESESEIERAGDTDSSEEQDVDNFDDLDNFDYLTESNELEETAVEEQRDLSIGLALNLPLPTMIFRIVDKAGSAGITSAEILAHLPASVSRKSLDSALAEITAQIPVRQPQHLRHLSIVAEDVGRGRGGDRLYRTLGNSMKAGTVQQLDDEEQGSAKLDKRGFPQLPSEVFMDDGRASLAQCRPVADMSASRSTSRVDQTPKKTGPKKARLSSFRLLPKPLDSAVRMPKYVKPRATSGTDQEEFERWARVTAERLARAELGTSDKRVIERSSATTLDREPARKRRRIEQDELHDEVLDYRIAEIEAEILCQDRPGLYINPPGAKAKKALYFRQAGRPRNAQIAVVKTTGLRSLPWFKEEPARRAPLTSYVKPGHLLENALTKDNHGDAIMGGTEEDFQSEDGQETDTYASLEKPPHTTNMVEQSIGDTAGQISIDNDPGAVLDQPATKGLDDLDAEHEILSDAEEPVITNVTTNSSHQVFVTPQTPAAKQQDMRLSLDGAASPEMARVSYSKAYVLAHSNEEFHHAGKGVWRAGPKPSKTGGRQPNPAIPHVAAVASQNPNSVSTDHQTATQSTPTLPSSVDATPKNFDKAYVLSHLDEDFHHVGGGVWRRGPKPYNKHGRQENLAKRPEIESGPTAIPTVIIAHTMTVPQASTIPPDSGADIAVRPVNFDKAYVLSHLDEDFHHVGNGIWRRGPRPNKKRQMEFELASEPPPADSARSPNETANPAKRRRTSTRSGVSPEDTRPAKLSEVEKKPASAQDSVTDVGGDVRALVRDGHADDATSLAEAARSPATALVQTPNREATRKQPTTTPAKPQVVTKDGDGKLLASDTSHQRTRIILDTISKCGGAYPGNKEMWYPYATSWKKDNDRLPQRGSLDRAVKGLVDSSRLRKITFSFKSTEGMNETRSILLLPTIDATSDLVTTLKSRIIESFPTPYLPPEAEVSDMLHPSRVESSVKDADFVPETVLGKKSSPKDPRRFDKRRPNKDEFPTIDGLTVVRVGDEPIAKVRKRSHKKATESQKELNARKQREFQIRKKAKEAALVANGELAPATPLKRRTRTSTGQHAVKQNNVAISDWLSLSSSQTFYSNSGTFGTGPTTLTSTATRKSIARTVKSSAARRYSIAETLDDLLPTPSSPPVETSSKRIAASTAKKAKGVTYDKAHVSSHPEQRFEHVGAGRWRLLDSQPSQPEPEENETLYDKAHVSNHPYDNFQHVGHGRYRWVPKPTINSQPDYTFASSSTGYGTSGLPMYRSGSLVDMLTTSLDTRTRRDGTSGQANPVTPAPAPLQPAQRSSVPSAPAPTDNNESVPSPTTQVKTSRSGRPLIKSLKHKANFVETPAVFEDVVDDVVEDVVRESTASEEPQQGHARYVHFGDTENLVVVMALTKTLCAGIGQEHINWETVAHAMGFMYAPDYLKARWAYFKTSRGSDTQRLQDAIREPFLAAYSSGTLPRVDFTNLSATDWPSLVAWVKKEIVPTLPALEDQQGHVAPPDFILPNTSAKLHQRYSLNKTAMTHSAELNQYFDNTTDSARTTTGLKLIHGETKSAPPRSGKDLTLVKSWCRAVAATDKTNYDAEAAARKISVFSGRLVKQATDDLVEAQVLSHERKSRNTHTGNFDLHRSLFKVFQRWPGEETTYLRDIAAARQGLMETLARDQTVRLNYHTRDCEALLLTEMVGHGQLKVTTTLPPSNNDLDAPFPRLSIWGMDGAHALYNSHVYNKERLRFPVSYTMTPAFTYEHGLKQVTVPTKLAIVDGEGAMRLPLWVDIHGNMITDMWDMVLRSVLHLIVYRPGITSKGIEKAHDGKLWAWEAEAMLHWMEETGLAISFGPGKEVKGMWKGGWRASEWWYCAFSPEIATWAAPKAGAA
ncbi:hypothetical protein LTR10_001182 [Elasticomyces elasticus]|nr:hypothetical protein LTR10_001182 [Elasticomyces elasticus]KAK4965452.1 hypothetical protein LTR42_012208 [Elasticomyces elasticus]